MTGLAIVQKAAQAACREVPCLFPDVQMPATADRSMLLGQCRSKSIRHRSSPGPRIAVGPVLWHGTSAVDAAVPESRLGPPSPRWQGGTQSTDKILLGWWKEPSAVFIQGLAPVWRGRVYLRCDVGPPSETIRATRASRGEGGLLTSTLRSLHRCHHRCRNSSSHHGLQHRRFRNSSSNRRLQHRRGVYAVVQPVRTSQYRALSSSACLDTGCTAVAQRRQHSQMHI